MVNTVLNTMTAEAFSVVADRCALPCLVAADTETVCAVHM
jgi:hypothetical protein